MPREVWKCASSNLGFTWAVKTERVRNIALIKLYISWNFLRVFLRNIPNDFEFRRMKLHDYTKTSSVTNTVSVSFGAEIKRLDWRWYVSGRQCIKLCKECSNGLVHKSRKCGQVVRSISRGSTTNKLPVDTLMDLSPPAKLWVGSVPLARS